MKNQYFGDINDYRKYGILRALQAGSGLPLAVCWMLTPDDGGPDGRKVDYLQDPNRWRGLDPEVYDALAAALREERRTIEVAEQSFLSSAISHPDILSHGSEERDGYFSDLLGRTSASSLVFFDPDNGIEVKSKPFGKQGAEKFLYWAELRRVYEAGHSCLVYQHYPRLPRDQYTRDRARDLGNRLGAPWVATLSTSHVLFLLAPQAETHGRPLTQGLHRVGKAWGDEVDILVHSPPDA
jgi:hypothetical protein